MTHEQILKTLKIISLYSDYVYEYGFTCRRPSINKGPDYTNEKSKMLKIKQEAEKVDKNITGLVFKLGSIKANLYKKELLELI